MRSRSELASSMSFCAWSRLVQKLSAAIKALSSPRRFCAPGTSKKPPQMVQLVRCGGQFCCNGVEHCAQWRSGASGLQVEGGGGSVLRHYQESSLQIVKNANYFQMEMDKFFRLYQRIDRQFYRQKVEENVHYMRAVKAENVTL